MNKSEHLESNSRSITDDDNETVKNQGEHLKRHSHGVTIIKESSFTVFFPHYGSVCGAVVECLLRD